MEYKTKISEEEIEELPNFTFDGEIIVIDHEDKVFGGFGGEIAASIGTDLFRYLDAPVQRVGSTFTPVGFNPILERAILPGADRIYEAAKKLLEY